MINLTKHSWLQSCKAFSIKDGLLSAYLYDTRGNLISRSSLQRKYIFTRPT